METAFETQEKRILYLDDEPENLESFRLMFLEDYDIYTATNTKEALQILEQHEIHVLMTDQRMPGTSGIDFLRQITPVFPNIVTMIVSGYSDAQLVISALNEVGIYQYIAKPWSTEELKRALDNALEKYFLRNHNRRLIGDLQQANQSLARKIEQLDTYVYRASHDIRGILTRFQGLCEVGIIQFHEKEVNQFFRILKSEATKMTFILKNHLTLNEIEGYQLVLEKVNFEGNFRKCTQLVGELEDMTKVSVNFQQHLQAPWIGDNYLMELIFFNLLHNAVVYGRDKPEVTVTIATDEDSSLQITFSDNGVGMESSMANRVFEKFFRGNTLSKGAGLGLHLVKLAIEKLGGSIGIQTTTREGTTFFISLPVLKEVQ